jgi:predicted small secreted protein
VLIILLLLVVAVVGCNTVVGEVLEDIDLALD